MVPTVIVWQTDPRLIVAMGVAVYVRLSVDPVMLLYVAASLQKFELNLNMLVADIVLLLQVYALCSHCKVITKFS
jgi:hypothetical protein